MKRTVWPAWLRVVVAVGFTVALYWPYAAWYWHARPATGRGLYALSPTGSVVWRESTLTLVMGYLHDRVRIWPPLRGWSGGEAEARLCLTLATVLPSGLVGLGVYMILTRWRGPIAGHDPYTRCRKCQYILAGLSEPRCPECGEAI